MGKKDPIARERSESWASLKNLILGGSALPSSRRRKKEEDKEEKSFSFLREGESRRGTSAALMASLGV